MHRLPLEEAKGSENIKSKKTMHEKNNYNLLNKPKNQILEKRSQMSTIMQGESLTGFTAPDPFYP